MIRASLTIGGAEDLVRLLTTLSDRTPDIVNSALRKAGKQIVSIARGLTPIGRTHQERGGIHQGGTLRRDISVVLKGGRGRQRYAVIGAKHPGRYYLHLVEGGTSPHMVPLVKQKEVVGAYQHPGAKAKPILKPAVEAAGPRAVEAFREALEKAIDEATRA